MRLRVTLWGNPDDVTAAAQRLQNVFGVLDESKNEPDETGLWVKRHLEVNLESVSKEGSQYPLEATVQSQI